MTVLPESRSTAVPLESHTATLRRVVHALEDLRALPTVEQLVEHAPLALCRAGFERAMISRVDDSDWIVERFHSDINPQEGDEISEAAKTEHAQLGPNIIELEIVRRRVPLLVPDVSRERRVNPRLAAMTGSRAYVAAPIAPEGNVLGFLHADRLSDQPVTIFDREVLSLFAQEFGLLVSAASLRQRFENLRASVDQLRASLGNMVTGLIENPITMSTMTPLLEEKSPLTLAPLQSQRLQGMAEVEHLLSEREREVLQLMALGETNGRIARRLVITEGTVKSHVRHILRKLNAANRAEAVCRWLQRPEPPR